MTARAEKQTETRARRWRIYRMDLRQMLCLFRWREFDLITLPDIQEFPTDAEVIGVNFDLSSQCWELLVTHESFEPVAENSRAPIAPDLSVFTRQPMLVRVEREELEHLDEDVKLYRLVEHS